MYNQLYRDTEAIANFTCSLTGMDAERTENLFSCFERKWAASQCATANTQEQELMRKLHSEAGPSSH